MKTRLAAAVLIAIGLVGWREALRGQELPEGTVINYFEVKVRPGMNAQWEDAWRQINARRLKYKRPYPYAIWEGDDNRYLFLTPIKDLPDYVNGWGAANQAVTKQAQAAGEPPTPATAPFQVHTNRWWLELHPEWSYTPATPRLRPDEIGFVHWDIYYLWQSPPAGLTSDEATKAGLPSPASVFEQLVALYRTKGLPDGFKVYSDHLAIGPEVPFRIVSTTARDERDFHLRRAQITQMLGQEGLVLLEQLKAAARRVDTAKFKVRRDLSYRWPT